MRRSPLSRLFNLAVLVGGLAGASAAWSQSQSQAMFGSWIVQKDGAALEMYSANPAGDTVGVICVDGQTCVVYVSTLSRCEAGRTYTGMVGADRGFSQHELTCRVVRNRHVYVMGDFPRAYRSLRDTGRWGLAILGGKGRAASYQFTLSGTHDAVGAMARIEHASLAEGTVIENAY